MNNEQSQVVQALRERKTFFLRELVNMEKQLTNILHLPSRTGREAEMVLMELQTFAEVILVIQALKEQKTVFLNLALVSAETAQRIVDFLAGGAYAADCQQTCLGENVFLLTSNRVILNQVAS